MNIFQDFLSSFFKPKVKKQRLFQKQNLFEYFKVLQKENPLEILFLFRWQGEERPKREFAENFNY